VLAAVVVAVVAAGCGSGRPERVAAGLPSGPPHTIRVALSDFRWPLDPALAASRDETALARALYATPLRTDPAGRVVPDLCSAWAASDGFRTWRFDCRAARAIARELRRVGRLHTSPARSLFAGAGITTVGPGELVVRLPFAWRRFPYALTAVAAAPRGVPGPFRLVHGSAERVVVRGAGQTIVFRRLSPAAAVRSFRSGELDEAPVPTGDVEALRARYDLRVRELLGIDVLVFDRPLDVRLRRAYRDTATRTDYQTLLDTTLATGFVGGGPKPDPAAFRRAVDEIPALPRILVRVARPPELAYAADILYGQWREAGLGPLLVGPADPHTAQLDRLLAPYPQTEALPAALALGRGLGDRSRLLDALARVNQKRELAAVDAELHADARAIPIAWVTDARLVSRRLRGWREDVLGDVDYARVGIR
jgi:hypothetical protein